MQHFCETLSRAGADEILLEIGTPNTISKVILKSAVRAMRRGLQRKEEPHPAGGSDGKLVPEDGPADTNGATPKMPAETYPDSPAGALKEAQDKSPAPDKVYEEDPIVDGDEGVPVETDEEACAETPEARVDSLEINALVDIYEEAYQEVPTPDGELPQIELVYLLLCGVSDTGVCVTAISGWIYS